jgi:transposase
MKKVLYKGREVEVEEVTDTWTETCSECGNDVEGKSVSYLTNEGEKISKAECSDILL